MFRISYIWNIWASVRFLTMAFKDMGLIDFDEPFKRFHAHGMFAKGGAKMSKSKGNIVNPDEYLDRYGADALRTYLMFSGNFQEGGDSRDTGIHGVDRFMERLWRYVSAAEFVAEDIEDPELLRLVHQKIHKVTEDLEKLYYNTVWGDLILCEDGPEDQFLVGVTSCCAGRT